MIRATTIAAVATPGTVTLVGAAAWERRPVRERDRVYEIDGAESRALATIGAFRVIPESDLHDIRDDTHDHQGVGYLWPACQWSRYDATNPMLKWDTAWRALRDAAGLPRFWFHDLRHALITELAELGLADHVLVMALAGLASQSRHSLHLAGSSPSAKLLIPLARRDVRVVEGARLESAAGDLH